MTSAEYRAKHATKPRKTRGKPIKPQADQSPAEPQKSYCSASKEELRQEALAPINHLWLRPGSWQNVEDRGDHLLATYLPTGDRYIIRIELKCP